MHYEIIANPASGSMDIDQKQAALAQPAALLSAGIHGLDSRSVDDFAQCAKELVHQCEVLVVAGGDGTFSDVINAIDTTQSVVAYLPLGTGNALQHALHYRGDLTDSAVRIREGKIHDYDLINCSGKKRGLLVSIGIEGTVLKLREQYISQKTTGLKSYFKAVLKSYFIEYERTNAALSLDKQTVSVRNLLSLMVVKQPYYGFGMKVVPQAKFDDRTLHILSVNSGLIKTVFGVITAFSVGNKIGHYYTTQHLSIKLDRPLPLQIDGNQGWRSDRFTFSVLPKALRIKC
jgi:diacylglycerol kinase (ATP)